MSDLNQELIKLLLGLYIGDPWSQNCVNDRFLVPLINKFGEDGANVGLNDFFQRCARRPLEDESNPQAFLYKCCRRAKYRIWRREQTYSEKLEIRGISPGSPCRIEVSGHELSCGEDFCISRANAAPTLNGKFGTGAASAYKVIDQDCLELQFSLEENEIDHSKYFGVLHIRTRKKTCSINASRIEDTKPSDPTDHTRLSPEEEALRKESEKQVHWALDQLDSEEERWLIKMWYFTAPRPTQKELAEQLGVTERTVRSRIKSVTKKLLRILRKFEF